MLILAQIRTATIDENKNTIRSTIEILQNQLKELSDAFICFELLIPRMGKRADAVLITGGIIWVNLNAIVIEFGSLLKVTKHLLLAGI